MKKPYPKVQSKLDPEFREPTREEADWIRKSGNQYAKLSVTLVEQGQVSKAEYESEVRRIFRQYIPKVENGRLRDHYKAFISRTSKHTAQTRFAILQELKRYDLASILGFEARFNREKDPLTEAKLISIEQSALRGGR